jgi:hypothetical protein
MFFFQQRQEKQNYIFLAHQVIPLNSLGWKIKDPINSVTDIIVV